MRSTLIAVCISLALPVAADNFEAEKANTSRLFDGNATVAELSSPVLAAPRKGKPLMAGSALTPAAPSQGDLLRLSEFADKLTQDPATLKALLKRISESMGDRGSWVLSPANQARLIAALERADSTVLDSFPVLSLQETKMGIGAYARRTGPLPDDTPAKGTVELKLSGKPRLPAEDAFYKDLGEGVFYGDIRDAQALPFGDSKALSAALNRLALNTPGQTAEWKVRFAGTELRSVEDLLNHLVATGHSIAVQDLRMFANFGDLWLKEQGVLRPVTTPFYVKTGLNLASGKELAVPVVHSEFNLQVRGPKVNSDIAFFYGIGGSAAFGSQATESQKWVGGRVVKTWNGAAAIALMERSATMRREIRAKVDKHKLPMGGYGILGACSDVHAMILGKPVFPQIRDLQYYSDGMTIDTWSTNVYPTAPVTAQEILDELPVDNIADIQLPELRRDIEELQAMQDQRS
jgi:hypothetical protein